MIVKLPFGDDSVAVDLRGLRVRPLQSTAPRGARDVATLISRAVDRPLEGPGLVQLATDRESAVVVVPDATRRAQLPEVLPVIINRLLAARISAPSISVLVACGTHPAVPPAELEALLGKLPTGVEVFQHMSRDDVDLTGVGDLRADLPLRINRRAAEADLLITLGTVRHHYFAGFGGGPKMIFPGIAGHDEIQANHSLVFRDHKGSFERHPNCEPGILQDNPVAEEIVVAADIRQPDMAVCMVAGRDGRITWAAGGPWRMAFGAAVERARQWYEIPGGGFTHLVACGGGRPGDSTLIQAHKGLDAICRFAEPGAEVIFVAELGGGLGSTAMEAFLADTRPDAILDRLRERYVQYGHTALRIIEKTRKYRVHLLSAMDPAIAGALGFIPVEDLGEIADRWRAEEVRGRVAVMAETHVWPRTDTGSDG